ncbi:uncharacterized protein LOC129577383 [Sitodiplosis mosellana]|uniref:uncharacterized protein LOC129577383 n=1 Tax=Sitodiplosis mosellana TaxID=263140 RepID=UPI002443CC3B|nr:uncharacterized protein LOC129577383 [Sitodiplosis mosellana]
MAKFMFLLALAVVFIATIEAINFGECPLSSQMASCTPKCIQDSECSTMGGICCPNLCNTKSCVRPKAGSQGSSSGGYKGSATKTATGVYCGNVKCSAYEKCDLDKSTKRQKCVRT